MKEGMNERNRMSTTWYYSLCEYSNQSVWACIICLRHGFNWN